MCKYSSCFRSVEFVLFRLRRLPGTWITSGYPVTRELGGNTINQAVLVGSLQNISLRQ
jgi:hypothetical protein